jgi:hypothetical protein
MDSLDLDLTTQEGVASLLRTSNNEFEWNANCDLIYEANGNDFPPFWLVVAHPLSVEVRTKLQQANA